MDCLFSSIALAAFIIFPPYLTFITKRSISPRIDVDVHVDQVARLIAAKLPSIGPFTPSGIRLGSAFKGTSGNRPGGTETVGQFQETYDCRTKREEARAEEEGRDAHSPHTQYVR